MKAIKFIFVLLLAVTAVSNGSGETQKQITERAISEGNNKFALSLYHTLQAEEGNLFFSPYSISTALAMTYAGARGETQAQMAKVLCFPLLTSDANQTKFHEEFGQIIKDINERGSKGAYELTVANALWGQKGEHFLKGYLTLIETDYGGGFNEVDFINTEAREVARQTINQWVEKKTKDKITELIEPGILDEWTRLVLTDAIYFKGKWASQFKKEDTKNEPFTLLEGKKVDVPMMKQNKKFGYMATKDFQMLELPYVNDELSMVILLPKKTDGLPDLEKELNYRNLSQWVSKSWHTKVTVSIPRFKMTQQFRLDKTLQSMGMIDAFHNSDFSGMDGTRELFISAVIHKAFVDVNEEGTEAAAATAIKMAKGIEHELLFKADHPFIFLIRDNKSGSILFLGRVMNPEK